MIASEKNAVDSKEKIVERYKGVDPSRLIVIPAKVTAEANLEERPLKVAAYVRVSTENDEQKSSYELQVNDFTERIKSNPHWEFAGIYSDEGISGTELTHRKGMLQMIEDAKAGKIDLILAKSIARFARNVVDCLSVIDELRKNDVGVRFDEGGLYTLDTTGAMVLTILATVAEEESRSKSFIMNWSVERRFAKGIFLTPALLGYDKDEDGHLIINEDEAETVKVIFYLFLNGWSHTEIAELLTKYGRKTKLGNEVWNPTSIAGIIENERHCGYVLAHKTYTPNFKDHKSVKNEGQRTQYIDPENHDPIVTKEVYDAANKLQSSRAYASKSRPLPVLSVIDGGILSGFVPIDKNWSGFSTEEYQKACESVEISEVKVTAKGPQLFMGGYKVVRADYFPSREQLTMTIENGKLRFSTACLKQFEDVEYVELLLNTVTNTIAIRPCDESNPNAIHWGRLQEERWVVSTMGCRGLSKTLFDLMSWEDEGKYRFRGQYINREDQKLLIFEVDEPVVTKMVEQVIVPEKPDEAEETDEEAAAEEIVIKETVRVYPSAWTSSFGVPVSSYDHASVLVQQHYAGDWDVLRPATELEEMNVFTADKLAALMKEAEEIMEGWKKSA